MRFRSGLLLGAAFAAGIAAGPASHLLGRAAPGFGLAQARAQDSNADDYKLLAFILSAALAGVAGATKSLVFGIATLTDVHWSMSGEVVLMTLVGGLGTVFGPVVGAAVIVTMQNYLAELGAWVTVIQGVIFVACVLAFRRGIIGEVANLLKVKL